MEGFAIDDSDLSLFRYEVTTEGSVILEHLGRLAERPNPMGPPPPIPDSALSRIRMSGDAFFLIDERISEARPAGGPVNMFGLHIQEERMRLQFDQGLPIWLAALVAVGLVGAGGGLVGVTLTRRERARRDEEARARQRALHAREAERSRLAREIHDGPLQDVHALRLLSGGAIPESVSDEATRIARELRAIAEGLRPPALGRFGLAAALSAHANRVKERYSAVTVGLDLDEDGTGPDALPDVVRSSLFRIAQEAITNAIEHGRATRVHVRLGLPREGGALVLEVTDNGAGLPWSGPAPDLSDLADDGHFGLVGMHERAEAIGGTFSLSDGGIEGRGACLRVTLPDAGPQRPDRRPWRTSRAAL